QGEKFVLLAKEQQMQGSQVVRRMAGVYKQALELSVSVEMTGVKREDHEIATLSFQEAAASVEVVERDELGNSYEDLTLEGWQKEWQMMELAFHANIAQVEDCEKFFHDLHKEHA